MNSVYWLKPLSSRILEHLQPQLQGMEVAKVNGSALLAHGVSAGLLQRATESGLPRGVWKFWESVAFSSVLHLGGAPPKTGVT